MNTLPVELILKIESILGADDNYRLRFVNKKINQALSKIKCYPIKCWMCGKKGPHTLQAYFFDIHQEYLDYSNYLIHYLCYLHPEFVVNENSYPGRWERVIINGKIFDKYTHKNENIQCTGYQSTD